MAKFGPRMNGARSFAVCNEDSIVRKHRFNAILVHYMNILLTLHILHVLITLIHLHHLPIPPFHQRS
jgi:hypothetical protein